MLKMPEKKAKAGKFSVIFPSNCVTVFHPSSVTVYGTFRV